MKVFKNSKSFMFGLSFVFFLFALPSNMAHANDWSGSLGTPAVVCFSFDALLENTNMLVVYGGKEAPLHGMKIRPAEIGKCYDSENEFYVYKGKLSASDNEAVSGALFADFSNHHSRIAVNKLSLDYKREVSGKVLSDLVLNGDFYSTPFNQLNYWQPSSFNVSNLASDHLFYSLSTSIHGDVRNYMSSLSSCDNRSRVDFSVSAKENKLLEDLDNGILGIEYSLKESFWHMKDGSVIDLEKSTLDPRDLDENILAEMIGCQNEYKEVTNRDNIVNFLRGVIERNMIDKFYLEAIKEHYPEVLMVENTEDKLSGDLKIPEDASATVLKPTRVEEPAAQLGEADLLSGVQDFPEKEGFKSSARISWGFSLLGLGVILGMFLGKIFSRKKF